MSEPIPFAHCCSFKSTSSVFVYIAVSFLNLSSLTTNHIRKCKYNKDKLWINC